MCATAASRTSRRSALAAVVVVAIVLLLMPIIGVVAIAEIATRPPTQPFTQPPASPSPGGNGGTAASVDSLLSASHPSGAGLAAAQATRPVAPEAASSAMSRAARQAAMAESALANFRATDMDGRELTASSFRGRVLVLDFWATWCAPCLKEVPTYQRLRREHDARKLEIIGVSVDAMDRRGLVSWLNRQQVTWTQIHDRRGYSGELAQQFKVTSLPTTYVFDAEGRMVASNVRGEKLIQTIAQLLSSSTR